MANLPDALRVGLAAVSGRSGDEAMSSSVARLIETYRSGRPASAPILASRTDVAAYATYRMPATFAAVRSVLRQLVEACPDFSPNTLLDVGGGTGAASWAVADCFPQLATVTVLDQVEEALALGGRLAARATQSALRTASWQRWRAQGAAELPAADLVTVSYVLGELTEQAQDELVGRAAAAAGLLLVVEPGTPAGYARILRLRETLRNGGWTLVAPCPHGDVCPLSGPSRDWCHFAARVNRSAEHRRLKNGQLGHEDEKFSFVAATRNGRARPADGRVLRHPQFRKGMVTMELCRADGTAKPEIVSKKDGPLYRAARNVEWGSAWPPPD
jgi:ribosomal protein RSM22 (predicted rRNA methylase)